MKKNTKLTKEENNILKSAESGEFVSTPYREREITRYSKTVRATSAKNKTISIRISEVDPMKLKAKAAQEGAPYQMLISSSLRKITR